MINKVEQLIDDIKQELGLLLSISFGIFLSCPFFQPFPFDDLDLNNSLLFVAGLGTIVFLIMVIIRISNPRLLQEKGKKPDTAFAILPECIYYPGIQFSSRLNSTSGTLER